MSRSQTTLPLADIDLLPLATFWPMIAVSIGILMAAIGLGIILRLHGSENKSREQPAINLAALIEAYDNGTIAAQQLAFELAAILRYLYHLQRLGQQRPSSCPLSDEAWLTLLEALDRHRYRNDAGAKIDPVCLEMMQYCLHDYRAHQPCP